MNLTRTLQVWFTTHGDYCGLDLKVFVKYKRNLRISLKHTCGFAESLGYLVLISSNHPQVWEASSTEQPAPWPARGVPPAERGSDQRPAEAYQWLGDAAGRDGLQGGRVEGRGTGIAQIIQWQVQIILGQVQIILCVTKWSVIAVNHVKKKKSWGLIVWLEYLLPSCSLNGRHSYDRIHIIRVLQFEVCPTTQQKGLWLIFELDCKAPGSILLACNKSKA